ncbi:2-amino-4-hydroxy-6-hydroxymethyldihydropteridine diphosphokinase [Pseudoclavibacter helvolus]|uniref:2-amino-4-hydroxy-6- hydroxymethyldihydropteridine diphosphokinase n=1 Tax=Pseudoclavibacter helvolus TaxID=255205 RepID=UPI003C788B7A
MTDHTGGHEPDLDGRRVADARAAAAVAAADEARGHAHEHAFVREPAADASSTAVASAVGGRAAASPRPAARRAGVPEPELDRILITRMHARGHHGVFEHERRDGQDFYVDAEAWVDAAAASASDHIGDTLHYGEWMHTLHAIVAGEPVDLIETLAERLAEATFGFDDAVAVRITVHKPQAPVALDFEDVAVSILRHRPTEPDEYLESAAAHAVAAAEAGPGTGSPGAALAAGGGSVSGGAAGSVARAGGVVGAGVESVGGAGPAVPGTAVPGSPEAPSGVQGSGPGGGSVSAGGAGPVARAGGVVGAGVESFGGACPAVPGTPVPGSSEVPSGAKTGEHVNSLAAVRAAVGAPEGSHALAGTARDVSAGGGASGQAAHSASDAAIVLDTGGAPNVPLPRVEPAGDLFSPVAHREQDERSPSDAAVVRREGGAPNAVAVEAVPRVRQAVIALGANLGDRDATLSAALRSISELPGTKLLAASSLYETPALTLDGVSEEAPAYRNAVALVDTDLPATALMRALHDIEDAHGRTRETRWGSRTLDLDLIQVAGELRDGELQLPHPRAHERAFVLAPWLEIDPSARLVPHGSVAELRSAAVDRVERVAR